MAGEDVGSVSILDSDGDRGFGVTTGVRRIEAERGGGYF